VAKECSLSYRMDTGGFFTNRFNREIMTEYDNDWNYPKRQIQPDDDWITLIMLLTAFIANIHCTN
jgi:hypothetical protein